MKAKTTIVSTQRGAIVLTSVVLLLTMAALVTLYTGQVKSFENQITLNEQNRLLAFNSAEAGLMKALGVLSIEPYWDGAQFTGSLPGQGRFTTTGSWDEILRESATQRLMTLESVGQSPDRLSIVTVTEQALVYPLVANLPDAPLVVAGGIAAGGAFEVVANPDGGGAGVPLSVWSDLDVDLLNGSTKTCSQQSFAEGNCSNSPYSQTGIQGPDILNNDVNFPDDLLEYIFNVPASQWTLLRNEADEVLSTCTSLGAATSGFIWVEGHCYITANTLVGNNTNPVILIVADGDLTINSGSMITGLVFSFRKPTTTSNYDIYMTGGARVIGGVIANHILGHANGYYHSTYHRDVLTRLQQHSSFQRLARVPGSWRDY